jgi:hypothetical protein
MIRHLLGLAVLLGCAGVAAPGADQVARKGADVRWKQVVLESCDITEADFRVLVSVRTSWLGREVLEMPLRVVERDEAGGADAVYIDPFVMIYSDKERKRSVSVQVGNPNSRGFRLRIQAREGGQEIPVPRLDQTFNCAWRTKQIMSEEGIEVAVVIALGPRPAPAGG